MPEETLKPCPFCGYKARVRSYTTGFSAGCDNDSDCLIQPEAGDCQRREDAVREWNTRATMVDLWPAKEEDSYNAAGTQKQRAKLVVKRIDNFIREQTKIEGEV